MARKLNLYVPTISECTIQRSGTEVQKVDNAKLLEDKVSRNFQSSASLRMVRENLAKTSEIMRKTLGQDTNQPSEKNEKTHDDLVKEILVLKKKVAQLEKDKLELQRYKESALSYLRENEHERHDSKTLLCKSYSAKNVTNSHMQNHSEIQFLTSSILRIINSVIARLKNKPSWDSVFHKKIVSETLFLDKVHNKHYGVALFQTFDFLNEILACDSPSKRQGMEVVTMSERKENIQRLYRQLSETIQNRKSPITVKTNLLKFSSCKD